MPEMKEIWPGWETVRVVGKGGFGKVYEVRKIDENVAGDYRSALKVISIPPSEDDYLSYKDDGYDDESITSIFRNQMSDIEKEFALMAQFKGTSHIVSYEEHRIVPNERTHGWDILIRMELLTSLPNHYNQKNGLEEAEVIKLGIDICKALELCGRKGIVHRDIKPQNIFVNEFGDYKLGDFGIARSMEHTTGATKTGTYAYMAPEIYQGKPYNASVDMYSLGLVLYWLLNERRLPFLPLPPAVPTNSQNDEALRRRLSGEEISVPKYGSPDLHAVILQACAFDPRKRFRNIKDMEKALESLFTDPNEAEDFFWEEDEPEGGVLISGSAESAAGWNPITADHTAGQKMGGEVFGDDSLGADDERRETVFVGSGYEPMPEAGGLDQETVFAGDEPGQETVFADACADSDGSGQETICLKAVQKAAPAKGADRRGKPSGKENGERKASPEDIVGQKKEKTDQAVKTQPLDNSGKKGPGVGVLGKYAAAMYIGLVLLSMWYTVHRTFGYYLSQSGRSPSALIFLRLYSLLAVGLGAGCAAGFGINAHKGGRKGLHDAIHTALFFSLIMGVVLAGVGCIGAFQCGLIFVSLIPLSACACLFTFLWMKGRFQIPLLVLLAVHGGNYFLCSRVLIIQRLYSAEAVGLWSGISSICLESLGAAVLAILWNRTCGQDGLRWKDLRIYKTEAAFLKEALSLGGLGIAAILFGAGIFLMDALRYYHAFSSALNLFGFSLNTPLACFGILSLFVSTIVLEEQRGNMQRKVLINSLLGIGFIIALWLFGVAFYSINELNGYAIGRDSGLYVTAISVGYLFMAVSYAAATGLWQQGKKGIVLLLVCVGMAVGGLLFGGDGMPEEQYIIKYITGWMLSMILLVTGLFLIKGKGKRKNRASI